MIIKQDTIVYGEDKIKYKVLELLGNGAFGYVYKIVNTEDNSIWALKTLPIEFEDPNILKGLINEADLAMKINHKNVIKYVFFHDGFLFMELPPYIIMEFANQGSLENIIKQQRLKGEFFSVTELSSFFNQLIDGMEAVNSNLIHRDIKPDNILIKDSLLKISDFGLSKIVQEQTRTYTFKGIGHIKYMAPEGWRNEKNTIQMDIYSMGIVFFELATLIHPLDVSADDFQRWQEAHLFQAPKRPEKINKNLSPVLSQAILRMIEKSTSGRFRSWEEVRSALKKDQSSSAPSLTKAETLLKKRLEKDSEMEKQALIAQKRQAEIDEFKKSVKYQIEKDILAPIKEIVDDFNKEYLKGEIKILPEADSYRIFNIYKVIIRMVSGYLLILEIRVLFDEEFIRDREINDYGETVRMTRLERPLLRGKKIMAWGYFRDQRGKGINLLLVEKEEEIYGEWFVLINTNSGLNATPRLPEPFVFNFNEIEKEVRTIGAMHIYNIKVEPLGPEHLMKIFEENI